MIRLLDHNTFSSVTNTACCSISYASMTHMGLYSLFKHCSSFNSVLDQWLIAWIKHFMIKINVLSLSNTSAVRCYYQQCFTITQLLDKEYCFSYLWVQYLQASVIITPITLLLQALLGYCLGQYSFSDIFISLQIITALFLKHSTNTLFLLADTVL